MNATSAAVVVDYQLVSGFDRERQTLLDPRFAERLTKPLAFWAVPSDRHLPLAFVGRSVRELIETPFQELYATPGVGPKKIASLLRLLARVSADGPSPSEAESNGKPIECASPKDKENASLPTTISEAHWAQWRACVARHGLGRETLGRLARSLQTLPRALWSAPLSTYLDLTLVEVRGLRAHGEKRVGAILEIFENLAKILQHVDANPHLAVQFRPRLVQRVESWVQLRFDATSGPSIKEVQAEFVAPLVEQVLLDGGELHADVVQSRLERPDLTVRSLARQKGLTRGRLYELWADAATIAGVRWPDGLALTTRLRRKLLTDNTEQSAQQLFETAAAMWFPPRRDAQQLTVRSELWQAVAQPSAMQMTT